MERIKISANFFLDELVPRNIYTQFGARAIRFVNPTLLALLEFLRVHFDKAVTVNNWATGGQYNESGYRDPYTKTGAKYSSHKITCAADVKIKGVTSREVYDYIMSHEELFIAHGLTVMENIDFTPTWNHLSVEYTGDETKILIINP